jgi:hypothetical protein
MKASKVMSIIALVWFSLVFLGLCADESDSDYETAVGLGIFAILYGIAFAIVVLVQSSKQDEK